MEPQGLLVGLGRAIRQLRREQELSQETLGLETGIHRNYIGGIERGERQPTVALVAQLSEALGIRPSELMRRAEELADS